jgi:nucleotide-binding universal stress UspA family protein
VYLMSELIVVGVDGSAGAAAALTFAATDAARRGARVRVVAVVQKPDFVTVPLGMAPPTVMTTTVDFPSAARQVAEDAVKAFTADHPALAGRVEMEVVGVAGHPATELVEQSREAALLVLGHRGRGAIASAFLGSVGLGCALHATCPVTIVRPTPAGDDATAPAVAAAVPAV